MKCFDESVTIADSNDFTFTALGNIIFGLLFGLLFGRLLFACCVFFGFHHPGIVALTVKGQPLLRGAHKRRGGEDADS